MTIFANYAHYYDLLYRDKNYLAEAYYVHQLIQHYAPATNTILELGIGTGRHAVEFIKQGYSIHGVDLSEMMLKQTAQRAANLPADLSSKLTFKQGDIRTYRYHDTFDAVIALFHVVSYQTQFIDLKSLFLTAKQHLKPGGIFIFDCWYGVGVLTDLPQVRVKRLEDENIYITRIAEPFLYSTENRVDVHYNIFVRNKSTNSIQHFAEIHAMRYLFASEIAILAELIGFKLPIAESWMSKEPLGLNTWNACFILKL